MSETPPEDPWLRVLAILAGLVLVASSLAGAGQWVAGGLALAAAAVPWPVVRVVVLAIAAGTGWLTWPPHGAALPPLGPSTGLAAALGGALLARKIEPGLRRPRNLAAALSLALLLSLVLPTVTGMPIEFTGGSSWASVLPEAFDTAPMAATIMVVTFALGPTMTAMAWPGPDAGIRRIMPAFILLAPLSACLWPALLAASSTPGPRLVAGAAFAALASCGQSAVAAAAISGAPRDGAPPGVVFLNEVSDWPDAGTQKPSDRR